MAGISLKRFVVFVAALLSIPASVVGVVGFFGVVTSLDFAWVHKVAPYIQTVAVIAALMWLGLFIVDYLSIRRAAFARPANNADPTRTTLSKAEREAIDQEIADAIYAVKQQVNTDIGRINSVLNELTQPKPEPTLKERTIQLANELFALLKQLGPEPPHALSDKSGTIAGQQKTFNAYFEWQRHAYYPYMAFFRDRVLRIDYELAAMDIQTGLNRPDIDPLTKEVMENHDINIKKIAEALLLTAQQMP